MEIFLANLQIKLDRIERPHCIASNTKPTSQPYKHSKYSVVCRYELQISAKAKSQIEQKSIVVCQLLSVNQ